MQRQAGRFQVGAPDGRDVSAVSLDDIEDAALWSLPLKTVTAGPVGISPHVARRLLECRENPQRANR